MIQSNISAQESAIPKEDTNAQQKDILDDFLDLLEGPGPNQPTENVYPSVKHEHTGHLSVKPEQASYPPVNPQYTGSYATVKPEHSTGHPTYQFNSIVYPPFQPTVISYPLGYPTGYVPHQPRAIVYPQYLPLNNGYHSYIPPFQPATNR